MFQNFSGQKLCGKCFKGKNLSNANFNGADIRGVNFTNSILKEVNLGNTNSGLELKQIFILFVCSLLLVALAALISGTAGILIFIDWRSKHINTPTIISNIIILVSLSSFLVMTLWKNFLYGFLIGMLVIIPSLLVGLALTGEISTKMNGAFIRGTEVLFLIASSLAAIALAHNVIIVTTSSVSIAIFASFIVAVVSSSTLVIKISTPTTAIIAILGSYIGWQASIGTENFTWIQKIAVFIAGIGGTSFYGADLTDANFTNANLKNTDFRGAILNRTLFYKAKLLERVLPGKTYLQNVQIRQLVVTKQGQEKNFDRQNLRGVNLQGAYLADASFVGVDLSEANLQDADLSRTNLKQTQLDATNFTGATLTGAFIEDWGITSQTKFKGARCEYVYMRSPTKLNPDPLRKPDNREEVFKDGDFADFIQPIFDTLDLYHNQGVDPRAIAIAFKQLAENNPEAKMRIVGMEVKGEDKFLLRAKTVATANKSELSGEYFDTYNQVKALPEQEIKLLLSEKDHQINRLENMVMTALERPSFYAQTYQNQGDTIMPEGSKKESNFSLQNTQFGGGLVNADTVNAEQIGGDITNHGQDQNLAQTQSNSSVVKTILILAANPKATSALRLDEEIREIDAGLQRAKKRELFDLKQRWAVRVQEVYQSLLDFKPQIVHFSGHGTGDNGLALEDEAGNVRLVDTVALAKLFELFASNVECVVLNACYSEVQAIAIAQHIPYVIGMNKAIGDLAAIKFSTGFYSALGTGESVEFAYKLGCNVIQLDGIPEHLTPILKKRQ